MARRVSSPVVVGRAVELAQLRAAVDRTLTGTPATVVVAGEAGVGKTRMVGELRDHTRQQGMMTLVGGCLDVGDGVVPYAPVAQALRSLTTLVPPQELDRVLGGARAELARLVPELATRQAPSGTLLPGRLFELLLGVLHRLAEAQAVLLVVEDVHWADESTRHLLGFLLHNLRGPVMLLLTYRSDELHRRHPLRPFLAELERSGRAERVELDRLDRGELAELLAGILGEPPSPVLVGEVLARSEGNPFFAEELLAARDQGVELPEVLRDVLLARVEKLPEETQQVLQVAAVAGRMFDHDLLAEVAGLPPERLAGMLREAVTHHVLTVEQGGVTYGFRHALVQEAVYDDLLPVQRVPLHEACARALAARAQQPDGQHPAGRDRVAVLGQLAHHWQAAHNLGEALLASVHAGQAAEAAAALPEAQRHYQRALELWARAPEAAARSPLDRRELLRRAAQAMSMVGDLPGATTLINQALAETDAAAEPLVAGVLLERLARYRWLAGQSSTAMTTTQQALAIIPAEPSPERARLLGAHGRMLMLHSRCMASQAPCEEAVAVARQVGDRGEEARALNTLGVSAGCLGHLDRAVEHLERAYRTAVELGDPEEMCRALLNHSSILTHNGRYEDAVSIALECRDLAARFGALRTYGVSALGNGAEALLKLGRLDEAERLLKETFDLHPPRLTLPGSLRNRAWLRLWRGDLAGAHADALAMQDAYQEPLDPQEATPQTALLAGAAVWDGRPDDARAAVAKGLEMLAQVDQTDFVLEVCAAGLEAEAAIAERAAAARDADAQEEAARTAADLIRRARDAAAWEHIAMTAPGRALLLTAEAHHSRVTGRSDPDRWAAAAGAWEELGSSWPAACARWRQAEALLATGTARDQVAPLLQQAWAAASRLGARPLLAEIEALGRRARIKLAPETPPGQPEDTAAPQAAAEQEPDLGLTPREREVLALVAQGHTNRQIAQALFISDKTASVHVSNILTKLGVANRAEAAVAAHRLGLTRSREGTL